MKGPARGVYFELYVVIDIYSRYVVAWRVEATEDAALAKEMLTEAWINQPSREAQIQSASAVRVSPSLTGSVVAGVGRGLSNSEIGAELGLTPAAVKAQISRLLTRLDLKGRVRLAVLARDAGPCDVEEPSTGGQELRHHVGGEGSELLEPA